MIRHLRWKLTAFNTAITGAVLVAMTLLSLFLFEKNTRNAAFQSFSVQVQGISAYLTNQERISLNWLQQIESAGRMEVSIRDGERPLYSGILSPRKESLEPQFQQARQLARDRYHIYGGSRSFDSCIFSMEDDQGTGYFAGVIVVPKNGKTLEVTLLCSLAPMAAELGRQHLVVALALGAALVLLGIFSWFFTGKMLRPIQENQQRQIQFTAAASHELRTPLAAILSAASAMERADPDQRPRFSQMIQKEGQRMTRLIGDLLTLATADSQSWEMNRQPEEPDMLLLDVYETYEQLAREKGLKLNLTLPEGDCPVWMLDRDRICQVLCILLDNALAYTPAPGQVGLGLTQQRGKLRFWVSDTGPGVSDQDKTRIFQRFHRGQESRSDRSHIGLGLCIGAEIVKAHGGRIWVTDAPGGGAVFVIEIP